MVCKGLNSLGLMTEAQPAAMADASLLHIVPAVLFQGANSAATPTGSITSVASPTKRLRSKCFNTCAALVNDCQA